MGSHHCRGWRGLPQTCQRGNCPCPCKGPITPVRLDSVDCSRGGDGVASSLAVHIPALVITDLNEAEPQISSLLNLSLSCSIVRLWVAIRNLHSVSSSHLAALLAFYLLPHITITPGGTSWYSASTPSPCHLPTAPFS